MNTLQLLQRLLARNWTLLRQVTGDDAYEQYLAHMQHGHAGHMPLSRGEFYRKSLDEKWRGINRCC